MSTAREAIIAEARTYLDTPWHHQARGRGADQGVDCIGLIVGVGRALGMIDRDCTTYGVRPDGRTLIAEFERTLDPIPRDDMGLGDVPVFWLEREDRPQHVGIVTDRHGLGLIHTYQGVGRVVEHALNRAWAKRIHSVWRMRGVD